MSIEKSQLKVLIANNLGADMEDRYEGTLRSAQQLEGASEALKQAAIKVPSQIAAKLDDAFNEGAIKDGMPALKIVEMIKKYLARTGEFLAHLSQVESVKAQSLHSEARGLKVAMSIVANMRQKEVEQLDAAAAYEEDRRAVMEAGGEPPPAPRGAARPSGVHPGSSRAAQRKQTSGSIESAEQRARKANGSLAERRAAAKAAKEKPPSNGKPIEEMTPEELEAELLG